MAWKTYSADDYWLVSDDYSGSVTRAYGFSSGGVLQSRDTELKTRVLTYTIDGLTRAAATGNTSFSSTTGTGYTQTTSVSARQSGGADKWTLTKVVTRTDTTYTSWA